MKSTIVIALLLFSNAGYTQEWYTNLDTAKARAISENKNILLVFSGSDWNPSSIALEKEVWQSEEFKADVLTHWVLLSADFPQKNPGSKPVNVQNDNMVLAEKYNRDGFFPWIVVLDKYGKVLGKTGYDTEMSVREYINHIKSFLR
ncbi:thioredoxin family protein [Flavobacterium kingsejongi]|uniref:Thiol-disulfide isomerase n=1 Tax=Flavobacterium kingsejongi TaxID=1678728 RepID=A0A2S1LRC4_9FLAO|nr:thioredoxin family protein [Flavobacterium kingsejongi]AWG26284.1 thiol-disulfide isomerase [Flavobacterium kingsejongi]